MLSIARSGGSGVETSPGRSLGRRPGAVPATPGLLVAPPGPAGPGRGGATAPLRCYLSRPASRAERRRGAAGRDSCVRPRLAHRSCSPAGRRQPAAWRRRAHRRHATSVCPRPARDAAQSSSAHRQARPRCVGPGGDVHGCNDAGDGPYERSYDSVNHSGKATRPRSTAGRGAG